MRKRNKKIKDDYNTGRYRQVELAVKYGVNQSRISQIVRNPNASKIREDEDNG